MNQKEIAKLANVSSATVSRVLNGDKRVAEKTRKAVEKVLAQNAYVTDINARNLRLNRTTTVGYLISTFENPYFISIYEGLEKVCSEKGYNIIIGITDENPEIQKKAIEQLLSYKVCAIVGSFVHIDEDTKRKLKASDCLVITLDREIDGLVSDHVGVDNEFGAMQQVNYIASLGHKKIGLVYGRNDSVGTARLSGFRKAMKNNGLEIIPEYMVQGNFDERTSYIATLSLMNVKDRPTAIVVHNNVMCIGVYKAISDLRLNIPKDISLVSFDNFSLDDYICSGVTLIEHPAREMGTMAAKLLFERLESNIVSEPKRIILPLKMIIRGSAKKL